MNDELWVDGWPVVKGGAGSGNHGHSGRRGLRGGSAPSSTGMGSIALLSASKGWTQTTTGAYWKRAGDRLSIVGCVREKGTWAFQPVEIGKETKGMLQRGLSRKAAVEQAESWLKGAKPATEVEGAQ